MSGSTTDREPPIGGRSILGRAVLAIALTIAFYLFAIAFSLALIGVPIGRFASGHGFPIFIGIAMVIAGFCILASLVPRRDKRDDVDPGPEITEAGQPGLFGLVRGVADEVGHPMPDQVFLVPDANAAVAEIGAPLRAKRRVLIVGLPVLDLLTVDQLRGVLAHEFGHYVGGDTKITRWVARTRQTIVRTVASLRWDEDDDGWFEKLVRAPFVGYAKLFMRITAAVSRREEFRADALAAHVVGRDTYVGALRRVVAGGTAFDAYWDQELVPMLNRGVRPPVSDGFRQFLSAEVIDRQVQQVLGHHLEQDRHDPYDSHPTLLQRLEALGAGPHDDPQDDGPLACTVIEDHARVESDLFTAVFGEQAAELEDVDWETAQSKWLEGYERLVGELGEVLEGRTLAEAPELVRDPRELGRELRRRDEEIPGDQESWQLAFDLVCAATILALVRRGFAFAAPPGEAITCTKDGTTVAPFEELGALVEDEDADADAYRGKLAAAGVEDEPFVPRVVAQA